MNYFDLDGQLQKENKPRGQFCMCVCLMGHLNVYHLEYFYSGQEGDSASIGSHYLKLGKGNNNHIFYRLLIFF